MTTLRERLGNPDERFSSNDIYQLFELLGEDYGWHRDPRLPEKGQVQETASMTIPHFEDLGPLVVRPRTVRDGQIVIPSLVDRILADNLTPSQRTVFNAQLVALMQTVVVSPPGIVDQILNSDEDYLNRPTGEGGEAKSHSVFVSFASEYGKWMAQRAEEAREKKSGTTAVKEDGKESAS